MAGVIGMSSQNGAGAVELFGHDETGEGVRHRHGTKRKQQLGTLACGVRPATGRTDGKERVANAVVAPLSDPRSKCFRGHRPAAAVEQNKRNGEAALLTGHPFKQGVFGLEGGGFALGVRRHPRHIGRRKLVEVV